MLSFGVADSPKDAVCQFEVKQADAFIDKPKLQKVGHKRKVAIDLNQLLPCFHS